MTAVSSTPTTDDVRRRLEIVRNRIADAGADPLAVTVVGVTKGFGPNAVRAGLGAGLNAIGENYADELVAKAADAGLEGQSVAWHFLGPLQTNKINRLRPIVACWQSVDSVHRAEALAKRAPGANVLVQVRLDEAAGRAGVVRREVAELVRTARDFGLDVGGLMGVAPVDPVAARRGFEALVDEAERLALPVRSIGMSDDLEIAVQAGSTMVRVGTALFGRRPPQ